MLKKILTVTILCFAVQFTKAQALTYYPWNSLLEVSSNPDKTLWVQLRLQGNSVFSSMNTEFATMITVKKNEKSTIYIGPGFQFNLLNKLNEKSTLNGYLLNIGTRIYPFEKLKPAGITFEISPYANKNWDIGTWRYLFGISYNFGRK